MARYMNTEMKEAAPTTCGRGELLVWGAVRHQRSPGSNLFYLASFVVNSNALTGSLPDVLNCLPRLEIMLVNDNCFQGSDHTCGHAWDQKQTTPHRTTQQTQKPRKRYKHIVILFYD
eukprot:6226673-Amphidinium_carterae.1